MLNGALAIRFDPSLSRMEKARIAIGPVANKPYRARGAEAYLESVAISPEAIAEAARIASEEANPRSSLIRGGGAYRKEMVRLYLTRTIQSLVDETKKREQGVMKVRMKVNGNQVEREIPADRLLVDFLREDLGLTGTKEGCEEGECGACTVIMNGKSVTSCLIPAVKADGAEILTVEGLAEDAELHPLQQAFLEEGAVQCGYCTAGMLLFGQSPPGRKSHPRFAEVKKGLSGNLCRCTGYTKIIRAVQVASEKMQRKGGKR